MKRIYHHWKSWECFKSGFYETRPPEGFTADSAREAYKVFLADIPRFSDAMEMVLTEWPNSCDQYLSNLEINRIAWMGQAAMCIATGVPSVFRGGFRLLSLSQQRAANKAAEFYIIKWERMKSDEESNRVHQQVGTPRLL